MQHLISLVKIKSIKDGIFPLFILGGVRAYLHDRIRTLNPLAVVAHVLSIFSHPQIKS